MKREGLTSIGSVVLAFLAGQHHNLHMLMLTMGAGSAGMSFVTAYPSLRWAMILLSVLMAGFTLYRIWPPERPRPMRITGAISVALTLILVGWNLYRG